MWRHRFSNGLLTALFSVLCGHLPGHAASPEEDRLLVLDLTLNGQRLDSPQEVGRSATGRWSLPRPLWSGLRLRAEPAAVAGEGLLKGHAWLDGIPGVQLDYDAERQSLAIQVPATAFDHFRVGPEDPGAHVQGPGGQGAYINYDLNTRHAAGEARWSGGLEWVGFAPGLRVTSSHYYRSGSPDRGRWIRLDTGAEIHDAARMRSLRIGDQITSAGLWGLPVRIGGIGFGTRFALQPGFLPHALPSVRGEASLPSTLDLLVNQTRVASEHVPAGPFEWHRLPVLTGRGDLHLQVTDLQGSRVEIVQPYLVSTQLLQPGLADFSIEMGRVREDYGIRSGRYGRPVLLGQYRRGVSDRLTAELRLERLPDQLTVGVGGVWKVGDWGLMQATLAGSERANEHGHARSLGLDVPGRWASLQLRSARASPHFAQLGADTPPSVQRMSHRVSLQFPWSHGGAGLTWVNRQYWTAAPQRFWILSVSAAIGSRFFLSAFVQASRSDDRHRLLGLSLVMPLQHNAHAWTQVSHSSTGSRAGLGWAQPLPPGPGWGHHLYATSDGHMAARLERRGMSADWRTEVDAQDHRVNYGAGLRGSLVFMGGHMRPARTIQGSFALLKVGNIAGIPVYRDQHSMGVTDADGFIVLNDLRPHQDNGIHVDPNDLPMDTVFELLQLRLAPALGSGVFADLGVRRARPLTLRLHGPDGQVAPTGTQVRALDDGSLRTVGFEGKFFEPDWSAGRVYESVMGEIRCNFRAPEPPAGNPAPGPADAHCLESPP